MATSMTADTTPPKILSVELSSQAIDVTKGDITIEVTARVVDDSSGINSFNSGQFIDLFASWRSPSGKQFVFSNGFSLDSGTLIDGEFTASITIGKFSEIGSWTLDSFSTSDSAGNFRFYRSDELSDLGFGGFEVTNATPDTQAPKLINYTLSSYTIDLTRGNINLGGIATATDDLSGISDFAIFSSWSSPSGKQFFGIGTSIPIEGDNLSGKFAGSSQLNEFSELGTWKLDSISISDKANNTRFYDTETLKEIGIKTEFEVIAGNPDLVAPKLVSYELSTYTINLADGDVGVDSIASITDNLSGVRSVDAFWSSPNFTDGLSFFLELDKGTPTNGVFSSSFPQSLGQSAELGTYTLQGLSVSDEAGNFRFYERFELEDLGIRTTFEVVNDPVTGIPEPIPTPTPTPGGRPTNGGRPGPNRRLTGSGRPGRSRLSALEKSASEANDDVTLSQSIEIDVVGPGSVAYKIPGTDALNYPVTGIPLEIDFYAEQSNVSASF